MALIAIETSCDETSVAVVHDGLVLANLVASQTRIHAEHGGVVPELASREHLRNFLPMARAALAQAGISRSQIEAVAATQGPGLPPALMIGFRAAQSLAFALNKPFIGIHHHEAHLYSPWISGQPPHADFATFQPNVSLIVSGGHTMLVHVEAELQHRVLGGTIDDAAGECFDKVAKMLGLPYPGGPELDQLAQHGNAKAYEFPRPLLHEANSNFSFSGLKTSVRYFLRDHPELLNDRQALYDVCASVQAAIVQVLVTKTLRAAERAAVRCVTASGGVTCNSALRRELAVASADRRFTLRLAEKNLCTDNAAMIGVLAERKFKSATWQSTDDQDIKPNWVLS